MDKTSKYRSALIGILENYAADRPAAHQMPYGLNIQLLFDKDRDQYQVLGMGWRGEQQSFLVLFHFSIQDGKIWLHRNVADYDILEDLEKKGIPKQDIVLGFQPPQYRQYSGYAVA